MPGIAPAGRGKTKQPSKPAGKPTISQVIAAAPKAPKTRTVTVRAHTRKIPVKTNVTLAPEPSVSPVQALRNPQANQQAGRARQQRHAAYVQEKKYYQPTAPGSTARAVAKFVRPTTQIGQRQAAQKRVTDARQQFADQAAADLAKRTPIIHRGAVTFRDPLRQRALQTEIHFQKIENPGGLTSDPVDIAHKLATLSDSQVRKYLYEVAHPTQTQAAGFNINPASVSGLIHGVTNNFNSLGSIAGNAIAGHNVAGHAIADAIAWPSQAVPAAYALGGAVLHPGTQGKDFLKGVAQQIEHPVKSFKAHPLFTLALAHGLESGIARTTGAIGRNLGVDSLKTGGRAALTAGGVEVKRAYSKDPIRQASQRLYDRKLTRPGPDGTRIPRAGVVKREVNKAADYTASRTNSGERVVRQIKANEAINMSPTRGGNRVSRAIDRTLPAQARGVRKLPKGFYRPERDIVSMGHEGLLRSPATMIEDLKVEKQRLLAVPREAFKDPHELKARNERIRTIDRVLADPKVNAEELFKSVRATAQELQRVERAGIKAGALDPVRAARAKLVPYALAKMGAEYDHNLGTLTVDGETLSNGQIRAHMREHGVNPENIAYLPHTMRLRGGAAYHQPFTMTRQSFEGQHSRTGALFQRGASPHDYQHVLETIVGKNVKLSNIHQTDQALGDVAVKRPDGQPFTAAGAENYLKNYGVDSNGNHIPGTPELVPVRLFNSRGTDHAAIERQQGIKSAPDSSTDLEAHFANRLNMTIDRGARNVGLVPKQFMDRIQQHIQVARGGPLKHKAQAATNTFRRAVLPFSVKWMVGNVAEGILRDALKGTIPAHDAMIGRKLIKYIKAEANGPPAAAELHGGLMYGRKGLTVRRTGAFPTASMVANAPVVHQVVRGMSSTVDALFAFNGLLEHSVEAHAIGKIARNEIQEMTGSWSKAIRGQKAALKDVAKGLTNTPAQVKFAKELDETLGKYSRFSPGMRNLTQTAMPFLPWSLNAVRFVLHTLPIGHPFVTALLAQAERNWQADYEAQHQDAPPGDLKTAIKRKGGYIDAARYTPFGFLGPIAGGDLSGISSPILPQIQGLEKALNRQDPFGRDLKTTDSKTGKQRKLTGPELLGYIANQAVGETVPGVALATRLREHGATADSLAWLLNAKTKPGSSHGRTALDKAINPISPVYVSPSVGKKAHSSWGVGSGTAAHSAWGSTKTASPAWGVAP